MCFPSSSFIMNPDYAIKLKSKQELDGDTERGTCEQHFFFEHCSFAPWVAFHFLRSCYWRLISEDSCILIGCMHIYIYIYLNILKIIPTLAVYVHWKYVHEIVLMLEKIHSPSTYLIFFLLKKNYSQERVLRELCDTWVRRESTG